MSIYDQIEPVLVRLPARDREHLRQQVNRIVGATHKRGRAGLGERSGYELLAAIGAFLSASEANARGRETRRAAARGEEPRRIEWRGGELVVVAREREGGA